ncbi:MAG: DUF5615 family PIN-like protein [Bacteroidota bacterium]
MAELKFYLDEHIPKAVLKGLKTREIDAISCIEADMRTAKDEEHLLYAGRDGRVIVTYDNDFLKLHNEGKGHAGIAFAPKPLSIGEMISTLLLMYQVFDKEDMLNQVEFI